MKIFKHIFTAAILVTLLGSCNNFFHDLMPPDGDRIVSFKVAGQERDAVITDNAVLVTVEQGTSLRGLLPQIEISRGASIIPITFNYVQAAFPSADILDIVTGLYSAGDSNAYIEDLIRRNKDFNVPKLDMPIDFSAPTEMYVIAARGSIRRYTVYISEEGSNPVDTTEWPRLLGLRFAKADNPELASDALCWIYEDTRTVSASALFPMDSDFNYKLIPTFVILGDYMEVDGEQLHSGESFIQFAEAPGTQSKILSVWRDGKSVDYTLNIDFAEDLGADGPALLGLRFAKYDNPELVSDAVCSVNERSFTASARAMYPVEMPYLSFALSPSFEIMGDRLEVDGVTVSSGDENSLIQFASSFGSQEKVLTVWRNGRSRDYTLTITFEEDPDTVRSITDFRFTVLNNSNIAANAVASIVNTDNTGLITVQVFYSGALPGVLVPRFISPGTVSALGATQTTGVSGQDFSSPLEYRVVSRNGLYTRAYTVRVEFINVIDAAPKMLSFGFSQRLNPGLVQDSSGDIRDDTGFIIVDVFYGGAFAPELLVPEFNAEGIASVMGSVQISGFSPQDFSRLIKYTVSHPVDPLFRRDYWVQVNMIRDAAAHAVISQFSLHPDDNPGLKDELSGRIDQMTGMITVFAPIGSGVTTRIMYPRFTAAGLVSVEGSVQASGASGHLFDAPIAYNVVSANGNNRRDYTVEVRELTSTIYVDRNAFGSGDGRNWENAFRSLQSACEAAAQFPEDAPKEIWIADGTYTPDGEYFPLTANTAYIGGFAGYESAKAERNVGANHVSVAGFSLEAELGGDVSFENLSFNGAGETGIDVVTNAADRVRITDCEFNGLAARVRGGELAVSGSVFSGGGIFAQGAGAAVCDTAFSGGLGAALSAALSAALHLDCTGETVLQRLAFEDSPEGLYLSGDGDKTLEALTVKNGGGIRLANSSGAIRAEGMSLQGVSGAGIQMSGCNGIKYFSGLEGRDIGGNAIDCRNIQAGTFTLIGSNFDSSGAIYVSMSGAASIRVQETLINGFTGTAAPLELASTSSGTVTVDRVQVNGSPHSGAVRINSNGAVLIADTVVSGSAPSAGNGALHLSGTGSVQTENLELRGITGIGVYINSTGGDKYFSRIEGQGISDRSISGNTGAGSFTLIDSNFDSAGSIRITSSSGFLTARNIDMSGSAVLVNPLSLSSTSNGNITVSLIRLNRPSSGSAFSLSSNGTVEFSDCIIQNNVNSSILGAVSYYGNGILRVSDIELRDINGRGIYLGGIGGDKSLTRIDGSNISGDSIFGSTGAGDFTLIDSNFNSAGSITVRATSGSITARNIVIDGSSILDTTDGLGWVGGVLGLESRPGNITVDRVTINRPSSGAGMSLVSDGGTGTVTVVDSAIRNNSNTGSNGAVYYRGTGSLLIDGLVLHDITGGGIYINGASGDKQLSNIDGRNISGNAVYWTNAISGSFTLADSGFDTIGWVYIYGSSTASANITVRNTTIKNSSGNYALFTSMGTGSITISGVTVDGVPNGSGLYARSNTVIYISDSSFRNCTSTASGAGILFTQSEMASAELTNVVIENVRTSSLGGGISATLRSLKISGSTIRNAQAGTSGGGIYIYFQALNVEITDTVIEDVEALSGSGGGIYSSSSDSVKISGSTIRNARASNLGGGIYLPSTRASAEISNTTIENVEANFGGGIYAGSGSVKIRGSTIRNAQASGSGGGISLSNSVLSAEISDVVIENVEAAVFGGGIYNSSKELVVSNVSIKNAIANYGGGIDGGVGTNVTVNDSRLENCRAVADSGGALYGSNPWTVTNTEFINCASRNGCKILGSTSIYSSAFRGCVFTDNAGLYNYGPPTSDNGYIYPMFDRREISFENCTFNNLRDNYPGENYIFNRWLEYEYPYSANGSIGILPTYTHRITLNNCTFNFNSGSAGLMALCESGQFTDGSWYNNDQLLMDNCKINNNGGQQPLFWFERQRPASTTGSFQFKANNVYNGATLDAAMITGMVTSGVVRLQGGAVPVIVP